MISPSQRPLPNKQTTFTLTPTSFLPVIPASEQPQTQALHRAANGDLPKDRAAYDKNEVRKSGLVTGYWLLKYVIEGRTQGKIEVTRRRRRRGKQFLDDLSNMRGYWKLKLALEEAMDLSQDKLHDDDDDDVNTFSESF